MNIMETKNKGKSGLPGLSELCISITGVLPVIQQERVGVYSTNAEVQISEVVELICGLESDHQEAQTSLMLEIKREKELIKKIDDLSLWKCHHLPVSVQKEYEAYAQDISELQRHLSSKKQELDHALSKAAKTEAMNVKLQEEIDFIEKHSPLLEDKLKLENEAMSKIKQAQTEATVLLTEAEGKSRCAQLCFDQSTTEFNKERTNMRSELDKLENDLQSCKDTLLSSENLWNEYNSKVLYTEGRIVKSRTLCNKLVMEKQTVIENEKSWNRQVTDLKYELDEQELKNKDLATECSKLTQEADRMKSHIHSQLSDLENHLHSNLHVLRDLEHNNKKHVLENEDLARKIKNSSKTRANHETDIQRMHKTIIADEEQTLQVTKDLSQLTLNHAAMQTKLADAEDWSCKEETRLKNILDVLRKQIMEEIRTSQQTQAQIAAILSEMELKGKENVRIRKEMDSTAAEVEKSTAELEEKITKLKDVHTMRYKKLKYLLQKLKDTKEKCIITNQQLEDKRNALKKQLSDTQAQVAHVIEQIKYTNENTEKILTGTRDLIQYELITENSIGITRSAIAKLQEDLHILESKLRNSKELSEHITEESEKCKQRLQTEKKDYQTQIHNKAESVHQAKADLEASLNENQQLANDYRILQMKSLNEKEKLLSSYDKKLKMESSLRDYLQSRMHGALVEFFKQRGLYSQAGLASFQAASQENALKILAVQQEMSKTIQNVSSFLTSLAEDLPSKVGKENYQSVSHIESKDKKSRTVQTTV
ncbi:hypothetical protein GDO86_011038 [Hymenochirus boettgeri]|uniref:Coiled-coil domain-containing protein 178 n=1 Tax=Hymenochirus boettgeri TaxID=247094 RepID=A0A8T2JHK4_9PIPI|nr:hypothetical protein GDO86_011038 [Hymenochirus boettgeri]